MGKHDVVINVKTMETGVIVQVHSGKVVGYTVVSDTDPTRTHYWPQRDCMLLREAMQRKVS